VTEIRENNNVISLPLKGVTAGSGFDAKLGDVSLDTTLLQRFLQMASRLVAHNLVTKDISLNDGVRDPKQAHRWSTTYSILNSAKTNNQLLQNLRALPGGRDEDNNLWYREAWEAGTKNKKGEFTRAGLNKLWKRIRNNAKSISADRGAGTLAKPAAEGYESSNTKSKPNTYPRVSKHCVGLALDATVPWREGASLGNLTIIDGNAGDQAAVAIVADAGLRRPLLSIKPKTKREPWHFEL
jgi:hypothetical protein